MPDISVIVPVYKVEPFLKRCVDSILGQSYEDLELILVDDGSPDSCGAMCDAFARTDSRIHVIHQENGGLSAARNTGIDWAFANSDSQWLCFVDSDDWVHPEYLRTLYDAAVQTGCKLSACGFYRTGGEAFPEEMDTRVQFLSADEYYCGTVHGGVTAVAWNKLYHKSLFETLRYPAGKLHEDEFTTYRAVYQAGQVAAVEAPLYAYYQHPEGIMRSRWNPRRLHVLEAEQQQIAFAEAEGKDALLKKAVRQYIFSIHDHLNKAPEEYRKQLRSQLRAALKKGVQCGVFPRTWANLWAWEEAYPGKLFWWLLFRGKGIADRITGKGEANG